MILTPLPCGVLSKGACRPPCKARKLSKPNQSSPLPRVERKLRNCVWSFTPVPSVMWASFCRGTSFVSIMMKPPVKSAGYCGEGDLMTCMSLNCEEGMMSNEKARVSASVEGTAAPFIHTLL